MNNDRNLEQLLNGNKLYGDNFNDLEIEQWFSDEEEGYSGLIEKGSSLKEYEFHEVDSRYGFNFIENLRFHKALGIGSAYGDEFIPIADKIDQISIIEASEKFVEQKRIGNTPVKYIKPTFDGKMPFADNEIDLVLSFSVLHHIPNVSFVISEIARITKPGGYILLREPVTSMREPIYTMDDWQRPRIGLTKRERGISVKFFNEVFRKNNLEVVNEALWCFPAVARLQKTFKIKPFNHALTVAIDRVICKYIFTKPRYHTYKMIEKLRPAGAFYVLIKT
jgi:SAM-dependent methyltransferase